MPIDDVLLILKKGGCALRNAAPDAQLKLNI